MDAIHNVYKHLRYLAKLRQDQSFLVIAKDEAFEHSQGRRKKFVRPLIASTTPTSLRFLFTKLRDSKALKWRGRTRCHGSYTKGSSIWKAAFPRGRSTFDRSQRYYPKEKLTLTFIALISPGRVRRKIQLFLERYWVCAAQ